MSRLVVHGTMNGYNNHHCHCDLCKAAWSDYVSAYRKRRRWPSVRANKITRARVKYLQYKRLYEEALSLPLELPE